MPSRPAAPTPRRVVLSLDLSGQLRDAIERSGLSASEVARRAGIDRAPVLRFLSGERDIRLQTAGLICDVLGLRLAEAARARGRPKMTKTERPGMSERAVKSGSEWADDGRETERPGELDT